MNKQMNVSFMDSKSLIIPLDIVPRDWFPYEGAELKLVSKMLDLRTGKLAPMGSYTLKVVGKARAIDMVGEGIARLVQIKWEGSNQWLNRGALFMGAIELWKDNIKRAELHTPLTNRGVNNPIIASVSTSKGGAS